MRNVRDAKHRKPKGSAERTAVGPRVAAPKAVRAAKPSAASRIADQVTELKHLLTEIGRLRPLRDPIGSIAPELTPPQVHCLMWLRSDGALSSSVVAQRVGCGLPSISGVIDRLVRLGYVVRERDGADRRVVYVKLTSAGQKIATALEETISGHMALFLSSMAAEDRGHVLRILGTIVEKLRDPGAAARAAKESA